MNINRRNLILIGAGVFVLLIIVLAFALRHVVQNNSTPGFTNVQFTSAITGQSVTDIVGQTTDLAPGAVNRPGVTIDDIDGIYSYLTADQAANAQGIINNFLMAHSGLASVHAGLKDNTITSNGSSLTFVIQVVKPQAAYQVTITTVNAYQTIPDVTIIQVQ